MMMPPRTVARFQCDLLNLNQAGPRAAGKSELTNRTGNSVLKAKRKYRARHGYAEADCYFHFLSICYAPFALKSAYTPKRGILMQCTSVAT